MNKVIRSFSIMLLLALSLLCGLDVVCAQENRASLSGVVIDAVNEEPLIGASVYIPELKRGVAAGRNGEFKIGDLSNGEYTVVISFMGYKSHSERVRLVAGAKRSITIRLKADERSLGEVIVTAKSEARKIREQALPVSVLSSTQLAGTVSNVSDILQKTMGVTVRAQGGVGSATRLSVRGLEGKRIGFFVDEAPMGEHSDFIDINDIPIDMIDRIEIYKGVVPAKFGGSAMGGAINVVLKEYPPRYIDVAYGIESFNTHKVTAVVKRNLPKPGLEFGGGGFYTHSDNNYTMESPFEKGLVIKRDHDRFTGFGGALNMKARKWYFDELEISLEGIANRKEIQGIFAPVRHAHSKALAIALESEMKKKNFLTEGLDLLFSAGVAITDFRYIDTALHRWNWQGESYPPVHPLGGEMGIAPSNSHVLKMHQGTKLDLSYLLNEQHTLNLNAFYKHASGRPNDPLKDQALKHRTNYDSEMHTLVSGLTYEYKSLNDKFLNALTGKYYFYGMDTKLADLYNVIPPNDIHLRRHFWGVSDAMRYRFTPTLMGKFSVGYEVRTPTENELIGDGFLLAPSGNLLPERGTNVNMGLLYDQKIRNGLFQVEFNAFFNYLYDMIRQTKGIIQTQYENFGEMSTLGAEIEAKADLFSWLYGYANFTYQDLRDVRRYEIGSQVPNPTRGLRMPNIPYLMANAGLEYHKENLFGTRNTNTRLFTDVAFVEEYFFDFEQSDQQLRRIPRSLRCDLGLECSLLNGSVVISGKIGNVTNAKLFSEFNYPLPGRTFSLRLRYVLK